MERLCISGRNLHEAKSKRNFVLQKVFYRIKAFYVSQKDDIRRKEKMELIIDRVSKQFKSKLAVDRISLNLQPGVYGLLKLPYIRENPVR